MRNKQTCTLSEVILATPDENVGLVAVIDALRSAHDLGKALGCTITIRHPITDKVIKTIRGDHY